MLRIVMVNNALSHNHFMAFYGYMRNKHAYIMYQGYAFIYTYHCYVNLYIFDLFCDVDNYNSSFIYFKTFLHTF